MGNCICQKRNHPSGTYTLDKKDELPLTTGPRLRAKAEDLCEQLSSDLSGLVSVGVVTGCFASEEKLVEHLQLIRESFAAYGFTGELRYIGSQLRDPNKIQELVDAGPLAIHLTVELFKQRTQMMKRTKASLDLESGRDLLATAKDIGAITTILYIAGLDSLDVMAEEFPRYRNIVTKLPQVQTFQAYTPAQALLREPHAAQLDYFLQTRHIVEEAFLDYMPTPADNYRGLWYTGYRDKPLAE